LAVTAKPANTVRAHDRERAPMSTHIERLAKGIVDCTSSIPADVLQRARFQLLGLLGATYAGRLSDHAALIVAEGKRIAGNQGDAWCFGGDRRTTASAALFVNAALACCHDFDDYLFLAHPGLSSVHTAVAVGLETGADLDRCLRAIVMADEVMGRMGASTLIGPQNGQLWTHVHGVGAAVAAGVLLELDEEAMAHAIALTFSQPNFALWPGFTRGGGKALSAAIPAVMGLSCARLAKDGMRSAADALEHPAGFWARFAFMPLPQMLGGWGETWLTRTLSIKSVPGCAYVSAVWEAVSQVLAAHAEKHGEGVLNWQDVTSIDVDVQALSLGMEQLVGASLFGEQGRIDSTALNFSIPATVALTLTHGRLDAADMTRSRLAQHQGDLKALEARTAVRHSARMTAELVQPFVGAMHFDRLLRDLPKGELMAALARVGWMLRKTGRGGPARLGLLETLGNLWGPALSLLHAARPEPFEMGDVDLLGFEFRFAARVAVHGRDFSYEAQVNRPRGAAMASVEELEAVATQKFRSEANRFLAPATVESTIRKILTGNGSLAEVFAEVARPLESGLPIIGEA